MKRKTWRIVALIGIGFFLHDAIWHALLVSVGMNGWVAMALSPLLKSIPMYGSMRSVVVSPGLLTRVLIVAVGLGAVGGLCPVWRAANLSPVEALRYE